MPDRRTMDLIQKVYFTDEAVNDFLVNKLDFGNWKIILHRDKLEFLTYLQQKHLIHIYFHNIRMAAAPVQSRAAPTLEQIIEIGFSGRGGPCFVLNNFLHLLLIALGFDTFVVRATFLGGQEDTHVLPIVRLQDGLYLLDVAAALPMDVPVPLHLHQLPHRKLAGGCCYEFRTHSLLERPTSTHGRYQIGGSFMRESEAEAMRPEGVLLFEFDLVPRNIEYFQRPSCPMQHMFTDPSSSTAFLQRPFMFRYLKHEFTEPDDNEFVIVFGLRILHGTKTGKRVTEYKSYAEMIPRLWEYFPGLDKEEMRLAFELFEKVLREKTEMIPGVSSR